MAKITRKNSNDKAYTGSRSVETVQDCAISIIINAHKEGALILDALKSGISSKLFCQQHGITSEVIVILDNPDPYTHSLIDSFVTKIDRIKVLRCSNLGKARAEAVKLARGEFLCFLDGDDIFQTDWPALAFRHATSSAFMNTIYHTEYFIGFGIEFFIRKQIRTEDADFMPINLAISWHFCNNLFAHRSIFERVPLTPYDHSEGYGSEDWHWSCETTAIGIARDYVPGTAYFYRLRRNSLGSKTGLVLRPTSLFSDVSVLSAHCDTIQCIIGDRISRQDVNVANILRNSVTCPDWILPLVLREAQKFPELYKLGEQVLKLPETTTPLYIVASFIFAKISLFIGSDSYWIISSDSIHSEYELTKLMLYLTKRNEKFIVLCGDNLLSDRLYEVRRNIFIFNYTLMVEAYDNDPYSLDKLLGAIISQATPRGILNINSSYLDWFTGTYRLFIRARGFLVVRILNGELSDFADPSNDRQIVARLLSKEFYYNTVVVKNERNKQYIERIAPTALIDAWLLPEGGYGKVIEKMTLARPSQVPIDKTESRASLYSASETPNRNVDISCILNVHNEDIMLLPTLQSIFHSMRVASSAGASLELIVVLDEPTEETVEVLESFLADYGDRVPVVVLEVTHRDLGKARKAGIAAAQGTYVALFDGDDLYSSNWLRLALEAAHVADRNQIFHPAVNLYFGADSRIFWHADQIKDDFPFHAIVIENLWTSLCFCNREIYKVVPIPDLDSENGYGFEDWAWNMNTIANSFRHRSVAQTCHFIRLKRNGGLKDISAGQNVFPKPTRYSNIWLSEFKKS